MVVLKSFYFNYFQTPPIIDLWSHNMFVPSRVHISVSSNWRQNHSEQKVDLVEVEDEKDE